MKYRIHENDRAPAYMQLYLQLRDDIVSGVYPYGSRLPSRRLTAAEIGVSVITVSHAYEILCDEGYAESRERSGYYVIYRDSEVFSAPDIQAYFSSDGEHTTEENVNIRMFSESENGEDLHEKNDSDEDMPYTILARTMRKVLTVRGEKILDEAPGGGLAELRIAIASYLNRSRGIRVQPDQIIIGSGAEYLYSLIVQILGHDRVIALEDPSYVKIRKMYEANGVRCELLKMGEEGIESGELAGSAASVLHVTPFNSFPSGVTASASKRREYISWAEKRNGFIIEDDFDSEYTVSTKAEDTLFSLEPERTVFYLNTFSRTIAPSLRVGYMILPEKMLNTYRERVGFYANTVPAFEQYVIAELINNGDFERHINRVRRKRRRQKEKE